MFLSWLCTFSGLLSADHLVLRLLNWISCRLLCLFLLLPLLLYFCSADKTQNWLLSMMCRMYLTDQINLRENSVVKALILPRRGIKLREATPGRRPQVSLLAQGSWHCKSNWIILLLQCAWRLGCHRVISWLRLQVLNCTVWGRPKGGRFVISGHWRGRQRGQDVTFVQEVIVKNVCPHIIKALHVLIVSLSEIEADTLVS